MQSFLIELFLRGLVLWLLSALTLLLLRRTAAAHRHLVCVLALSVVTLLPFAPQRMPALRLLPAPRTAAPERLPVPFQNASRVSDFQRASERAVARQWPPEPLLGTTPPSLGPTGSGTTVPGMAAPLAPSQEAGRRASAVLVTVWELGVATLLLRLLVALLRLRRLEATSQEEMLGSIPIRVSAQIGTPITWGIRRHVILLPSALLSGDPALCETALRHEQAHIARWDWVWNLFAEIVCALFWFQPAAWWLRARMRLESERASDDRVLLSGVAGPDYAAHLLEIVRSVDTHEVAPAMAHCGGMEERLRHILDSTKPRSPRTTWLAISTPFALALLSLACLRVAARTQTTQIPADRGVTAGIPDGASFRQPKSAGPAENSGTANRKDGQEGQAASAPPLDPLSPAALLSHVTWGSAVDGLQPGFLPTTPDFPTNRRVALNTHVAYKVLVRNVTDREYLFEFQSTKYGPWTAIPYLIPNGDLRAALGSRSTLERFRAQGVSDLALASPTYGVKLAPGEAVVVPEDFGLSLGNADKESYPRMVTIPVGMNWLLHPITIRQLTSEEKAQLERMSRPPYSSNHTVLTLDREGKARRVSAPPVGAADRGKPLFAGIQLEVGTNWDRTLTGHSNAVSAEVFSPDSKRLVTGSADGTAIVWDAKSGRSLFTLKGRTAAISSILYTPDSKCIVTGCTDGAIHLWDSTTGEKRRSLAGPGGGVCALDISSDGANLLGGYETGKVTVWNTETGQDLATFTYNNRLLAAAISPDGKSIAAGYQDFTLKAWDLPTQKSLLSEKLTESEGITGVHFDTQDYLYTWDREEMEDPDATHSGKIKTTGMTVWGVRPRRILSKITVALPPGAISHRVAYANFAMLFGLSEGRVVLNNMHDGPVRLEAHEGPVAAVAMSPDGALGATGGQRHGKGEAKIWDMQAHKPTASQP